MSTDTADDRILTHLDRLIAALEIRTSAQAAEVMALLECGDETRGAEEALWRNIDNLLALRRQQMHVSEMLIESARGSRRLSHDQVPSQHVL